MSQLMVYLNNGKDGSRRLVNVELIKSNKTTILVRLPDGHSILRKKSRDLPLEKGSDEDLQ
jgi:hypothetical protein